VTEMLNKLFGFSRHTGKSRYPWVFQISGFWFAPAIASLPGMTVDLRNELQKQLATVTWNPTGTLDD